MNSIQLSRCKRFSSWFKGLQLPWVPAPDEWRPPDSCVPTLDEAVPAPWSGVPASVAGRVDPPPAKKILPFLAKNLKITQYALIKTFSIKLFFCIVTPVREKKRRKKILCPNGLNGGGTELRGHVL